MNYMSQAHTWRKPVGGGCLVHTIGTIPIICLSQWRKQGPSVRMGVWYASIKRFWLYASSPAPNSSPSRCPASCTFLSAILQGSKTCCGTFEGHEQTKSAHKQTNALFKWARPTRSNSLTRVLTHEVDKGALG
jgi:hypothetical protein